MDHHEERKEEEKQDPLFDEVPVDFEAHPPPPVEAMARVARLATRARARALDVSHALDAQLADASRDPFLAMAGPLIYGNEEGAQRARERMANPTRTQAAVDALFSHIDRARPSPLSSSAPQREDPLFVEFEETPEGQAYREAVVRAQETRRQQAVHRLPVYLGPPRPSSGHPIAMRVPVDFQETPEGQTQYEDFEFSMTRFDVNLPEDVNQIPLLMRSAPAPFRDAIPMELRHALVRAHSELVEPLSPLDTAEPNSRVHEAYLSDGERSRVLQRIDAIWNEAHPDQSINPLPPRAAPISDWIPVELNHPLMAAHPALAPVPPPAARGRPSRRNRPAGRAAAAPRPKHRTRK